MDARAGTEGEHFAHGNGPVRAIDLVGGPGTVKVALQTDGTNRRDHVPAGDAPTRHPTLKEKGVANAILVWLDPGRLSRLIQRGGRVWEGTIARRQVVRCSVPSFDVPPLPEGGEHMSIDSSPSTELPSAEELSEMDDSVLAQAVRRFHAESSEAKDPIAAFGAFNQHGSSPW